MMKAFDEVPPILTGGLRRRRLLRQVASHTDSRYETALADLTMSLKSAMNRRRASVELYWLPLGAGDPTPLVRWNGRIFEALVARRDHRKPQALYHSALVVRLDNDRYVIEMTPAWQSSAAGRGVVCEGAVGFASLRRIRLFRYEVRRWLGGVIKDASDAVDSPLSISTDPVRTQLLLNLVPWFPAATWGRDELAAGEMWNSNSLNSWLLARSHHKVDTIAAPARGRAPGWDAGLVVAARGSHEAVGLRGQRHLAVE